MSSFITITYEGIRYPLTAALGNDGIYDPLDSLAKEELTSLVNTLQEDNPWWMVDLERVYCIWAVRILNRGILYNLKHQ